MGFIQNPEHLVNYLNKQIKTQKEAVVGLDLPPAGFIKEHVYRSGLADRLAWEVKTNGIGVLDRANLFGWIRANKFQIYDVVSPQIFSPELYALGHCLDMPGVYSFWDGEECLYIGMSTKLGDRLLTSAQRVKSYDRQVHCRFIETTTASDAAILEMYLVAKYKPILNGAGNFGDGTTLELKGEPSWSEPVPCFVESTEQ